MMPDSVPNFRMTTQNMQKGTVMTLDDLEPIPMSDPNLDARDYHQIAIDLSDGRSDEPLEDIGAQGIAVVPYYHLSDGSNPPYCKRIQESLPTLRCRRSLISMLNAANNTLAVHGCEIVVYDAYRSVSLQHSLWEWALEDIARKNPGLKPGELEALTSQYSSDPRRFERANPTTWPTHTTGASIDVMLRDRGSQALLDMGAAFDDLSSIAHTDHMELALGQGGIAHDNPALLNRRLLYWAMRGAGFSNYPAEYWHFDYGNQMYVLNAQEQEAGVERAWYGYHEPAVPTTSTSTSARNRPVRQEPLATSMG
jgi:D-alanyl-D-alanine dipeptidase